MQGVVAPAEGEEDPALTEAKGLYKEGEIKFQTADYEEALALWKRAYALLPDGEETRAIRHALVYNIAEAHSRAYDVTRNPAHLRKAKILLENYRAEHRALYGDEPEAVKERTEADDRIAELDKKIAESEEAGETATPLTEGGGTTGGGTGEDGGEPAQTEEPKPAKPLTPSQQWDAEVKADPVLGPKWEQGTKRVVGGAVLTGIGSIFAFISLGAFLAAPGADNGIINARTGLYITGGVMGAIALGLIIPGGVLLGKGVAQRKEVKQAKPKPSGMLVPVMVPHGGGVGWTMRF